MFDIGQRLVWNKSGITDVLGGAHHRLAHTTWVVVGHPDDNYINVVDVLDNTVRLNYMEPRFFSLVKRTVTPRNLPG